VTAVVGLLAVAVTLLDWQKVDVSFLEMNRLAWQGQPWRLVTSALPHGDLFHLLFNLVCLWLFGTLVEEVFGHWKTALLILFLAAGSQAAEYAFMAGGIGLSGVGYGLFGMLWVLSRTDERFEGAIDRTTVLIFLGWFVLCCVVTALDIWRFGNVAHGAGAILGALVGFAITFHGVRRLLLVGLLAGLTVGILLASSVGRPYVNLSRRAGNEFARQAYEDQTQGHNEEAIRLYKQALEYDPRHASWWFNLGIAYQTLGKKEEALESYEQAAALEPDDKSFRSARDAMRRRLGK
jgi:GlpG protein